MTQQEEWVWWKCWLVFALMDFPSAYSATKIASGEIKNTISESVFDGYEIVFQFDDSLGANQSVAIDYFQHGCNDLVFPDPPPGSEAKIALANLLQAGEDAVAATTAGSTSTTLIHKIVDVKQIASIELSMNSLNIPIFSARYCVRLSLCDASTCNDPMDLIDIFEVIPVHGERVRAEAYLCHPETGLATDCGHVDEGETFSICVRTDAFPTISVISVDEFALTGTVEGSFDREHTLIDDGVVQQGGNRRILTTVDPPIAVTISACGDSTTQDFAYCSITASRLPSSFFRNDAMHPTDRTVLGRGTITLRAGSQVFNPSSTLAVATEMTFEAHAENVCSCSWWFFPICWFFRCFLWHLFDT